MYPRWPSDASGPRPSLPVQGDGGLGETRQDLFAEPLLDLEQQLSAELSGVSWAVVSFVAEDAAWCDWIYRCLNGYPLPASLVERVTTHGFRRPDCLSIFPDLRDPAYQENTAQALESSAYLIVVSSPQSARADRIDESIRAFKQAGGEERIIALVVDGSPEVPGGEQEREHLGVADFEWLPAWLRWRCDEKGFCPADRSEPRVVDGRRSFASLQQVRDALLTAVIDMEAGELERLGAFTRPLPELAPAPKVPAPSMPPSLFTDLPAPVREPAAQRDAAYMIGVAVVLIVVAVIFGMKSFRELSADEPQSALSVAPRATPHVARFAGLPPASEPEPKPASEAVVPMANLTAVLTPELRSAPGVARVSLPMDSNLSQVVAAGPVAALTRLQPPGMPAKPAAGTAAAAAVTVPASPTDDAVLLDEVKTLERHGDEIVAERRTEDALDLYRTALVSAVEYANRKGSNAAAKDHVVMLLRKLGMLQVQNASTAEARTTYQQARKVLLQLKAQNTWNRERAKALDEIESRLMSLPRD